MTQRSSRWAVAAMLLVVAAAWVPLYLQRRRAHEPNVDDYLYALQSLKLTHAGSFGNLVHDILHTGQTAPLVPLLAAPGAAHGVDGAVAVELPLLLLLAGGAWLLARRWVGPWEAALIGLAAAANQAVLGWSLMMHFSVAASVFCLWSLAAYLWSEGFQRWSWSIVTGISVALLLLSRSIAPIYVIPFAIVVAADSLIKRRLRWTQAGAAVLIVLLVAGPWWLVSGETAFHYLRTAGYEPSSGSTSTAAHLSLHSLLHRVRWTLSDLGTFQSVILVAAPITAVLHRRRMPGSLVVVSWLALTLLGLATSSNVGTGFGLPLVAVAIAIGGAVVFARSEHDAAARWATTATAERPTSWRLRGFVLAGIVVSAFVVLALLVDAIDANSGRALNWPIAIGAIIVIGALMTFRSIGALLIVAAVAVGFAASWSGGLSQWWLGVPYRRMALTATNGAHPPNIDAVGREIARAIVGHRTLVVRDDDLFNWNGLIYAQTSEHLRTNAVLAPFANVRAGLGELDGVNLLLAGSSPTPYHRDIGLIEKAAAQDGWTEARTWNLACGNSIDLWQKSSPRRHRHGSLYQDVVLGDSPAAYWRLDDTACTASDASGNGNAGAYLGQPITAAHPLIKDRDAAAHLDGTDNYITFPDLPNLSTTDAISFEAWVRPDRVPKAPQSAWQILSKWGTALLYLRGGPAPKFVFALYDKAKSAYSPTVTSTTTVNGDLVYHVVGTYDGSDLRMFVNGSLESTVPYHGLVENSVHGGAVASRGWGDLPTPHFKGILDEAAIYGRALAPQRIRIHYRVGSRRPAAPVTATARTPTSHTARAHA
jgi:Concanavalin A-like lectin/glucanases superfamily